MQVSVKGPFDGQAAPAYNWIVQSNKGTAMKLRDHPRAVAIRRRAMKRWLRSRGVVVPDRARFSESALRRLVRDNSAGAVHD